ncbi:serine hydrolase [Allokutzneria albata]|uniref:Beta-lactamase class A n=1 Tax=Allokutzneria albata TaxID=211114 RepID=A0A1G9VRY0_ALLAB|nr:serine hydrolase [Allokutzneria albata]SDM74863.1 Beta-lactamase class A [Allokutzneria albata]
MYKLAAALAVLALPVTALPGAAQARPAAAAPACSSSANPALAQKLAADIATALKGRQGTAAVSLRHPGAGLSCTLNAGRQFQSASVIKVTILAAVLRKAQDAGRGLTAQEKQWATAMITKSDNDSATALWDSVTAAGMKKFMTMAGMRGTTIDSSGWWGKTHITATDQMAMLTLLTTNNSVLTAASRAYVLDLMGKVVAGQRWGTPAGAPAGTTVRVKNGWVDRGDGVGWRINSLGVFSGKGKDYQIVVLTEGNSSEGYGHTTIEGVAKAIHKDLDS